MVARGGIEPPTRGFSVAGTVALAARQSKSRQGLSAGAGPRRGRLLHRSKVAPESLQALSSTEQRGEVGRIDEHDLTTAAPAGRHPEKRIDFAVSSGRPRVRPVSINRLSGEYVNHSRALVGHSVLREMHVKAEIRDAAQEARLVEVLGLAERHGVTRALDDRGAKSVLVVHRHLERLHQSSGIRPESLLSRHEPVAVVQILDLALV